jgi:hypothetical protein
MTRSLGLATLAALFLVGCEQVPLEPTRLSPDAVLAAKGPVESSARGSGHFTYLGEYRTFAFTVGKSVDGTTTGQFQLQSRHTDSTLRGKVECISFDGNSAWFASRITHTNNPAYPVGMVLGTVVVDNGEGRNANPDQVSLAFPFNPQDPPVWCNSSLATIIAIFGPPIDIENGNVQVKP